MGITPVFLSIFKMGTKKSEVVNVFLERIGLTILKLRKSVYQRYLRLFTQNTLFYYFLKLELQEFLTNFPCRISNGLKSFLDWTFSFLLLFSRWFRFRFWGFFCLHVPRFFWKSLFLGYHLSFPFQFTLLADFSPAGALQTCSHSQNRWKKKRVLNCQKHRLPNYR